MLSPLLEKAVEKRGPCMVKLFVEAFTPQRQTAGGSKEIYHYLKNGVKPSQE